MKDAFPFRFRMYKCSGQSARALLYVLEQYRKHALDLVSNISTFSPFKRWRHVTYLRCGLDERQFPKGVNRILDQLHEGDDEPPGVRSLHEHPLKQNARDLLAGLLLIRYIAEKEVEEGVAEELSMTVGIAKLISDSAEEVVTAFWL